MSNKPSFGTQPREDIPINVVNNPGVDSHRVHVNVSDLCPMTHNPLPDSTIFVSYEPNGVLLELYSLTEFALSFRTSKRPMDLEEYTLIVAQACADVLGLRIFYTGDYLVDINGEKVSLEMDGFVEPKNTPETEGMSAQISAKQPSQV